MDAADFAIAPLIEPRVEEGNKDRTMVLNMGPQHPFDPRRAPPGAGNRRRNRPAPGARHRLFAYRHRENLRGEVLSAGGSPHRPHRLSQPDVEQSLLLPRGRKALQLEIPPRAQFLRVLLNELTRLQSHLVWLGTHAMDIGALTLFLYTFREREEILKIFEDVSGQRMMGSYFRVGGIALEPPVDFYQQVQGLLKMMPEKIDEYENLLNGNPIWIEPSAGCGLPQRRRCHCPGSDRPALARQRRRLGPAPRHALLRLREVPVQSPRLRCRRCLDPLPLRVEEMRESVKICQQALDGMPQGPIKANAPKVVLPDREKMKTEMESLIYHFKIVTEGFAVPAGQVYQAIESPRGEMGYFVVSDGTAKPYRVHMRNPTFASLQALETMCVGRLLADVVAVIGSIDIVLGEIDR